VPSRVQVPDKALAGSRYRAGRCMDYETSGPAEIAAAIASEIGHEVDYRPVAPGGAARAGALLADLL
jgi:hypothetical protein